MANEQNLKPIKTLTSEEAKKRGSAGGKKSVQSRREKKYLSQIYADFLMKKHKTKDGDIEGDVLLEKVVMKVLLRGDSSSVSMIKEIRESTEGNKMIISGSLNNSSRDLSKLTMEELEQYDSFLRKMENNE